MGLRDEVDALLPSWRQWYPSLFDAAADLGLIRARVCPPGSLLLSRRHADIQRDAEEMHRERWGGGPPDEDPQQEQQQQQQQRQRQRQPKRK